MTTDHLISVRIASGVQVQFQIWRGILKLFIWLGGREDLGSGLQNLLRQFDSGPNLNKWQNKDSIFDIIISSSRI